MRRIRRKQIALFLSLLLTAFMLCQGMAQAAVVGASVLASQPAPMAMSCHDDTVKKPQSGCPSDCQHVDKASDSSSLLLAVLDHVAPVIIFRLPAVTIHAGAIQLASLSPVPPDPDPPVALRFHRFRE